MKSDWKADQALIVILVLYIVTMIVSIWTIVNSNDGQFIYVLDDSYIHMAVAQNFANYQVWGTTPHEFNSATSSLLYPFLLSVIFWLVGSQFWIPLALNIIFGLAVLILTYRLLRHYGANDYVCFAFLLLLFLATPMPINIFNGMEHILHILLALMLVYFAAEILSRKQISRREIGYLFLLAFLQGAIRYEGLFVVAIISGLLLLRLRPLVAIGTALSGSLSLVAFGLYSLSQANLFLPNSVYLKGNVQEYSGLWDYIERILPHHLLARLYVTTTLWIILIVLALAGFLFYLQWRKGECLWWTKSNILAVIFTGMVVIHSLFAGFMQWRHEAYLLALFFVISGTIISQIYLHRPETWNRAITIGISLVFFLLSISLTVVNPALRSSTILNVAAWSDDIYRQQYQMGLFIQAYYPESNFVINDIGAISYLNQISYVDLWGLGTLEVARVGGRQNLTKEELNSLIEQYEAQHAIVYNSFMQNYVPENWIYVGSWTIENVSIVADATVDFYAATEDLATNMLANMQDFEVSLPFGVSVTYVYQK